MDTAAAPSEEEAFMIKNLETGERYRVNESGDQVEISDGERVPVDEFLDLFGYLRIPRPTTPRSEEGLPTTPSERSSSVQGHSRLLNLVNRARRRISESPPPSLSRGTTKDILSETPRHVSTNKRSEKILSDLRLVQEMRLHQGVVWVMQFSPDQTMLATGGEDGRLYIWRVIEDRNASSLDKVDLPVFDPVPFRIYTGHKSDILDICWASGSEFVLSTALDKNVRLWHMNRENCVREFPHTNYVTSIRFHPTDSRKFISGSGDGVLRLWTIPEARVIASTSIISEKDIFTALCFSEDGRTIVAGCFDGRCRIYTLNADRLEKRAEIDVKNRAGKHRKGTKVTGIVRANVGNNTYLVSTHDSRIRLLQATTPPRDLCKFKGHENDSGRPIVASPTADGAFMISGSDDGKVFVWKGATLPFKKQEREKVSEWEAFQAHHGFCPCALFCPPNCRRSYEKLDVTPPSNANYHALMRMIGSATPRAGDAPAEFSLWGQVVVTGGSRGEIRVWENFGVPTQQ